MTKQSLQRLVRRLHDLKDVVDATLKDAEIALAEEEEAISSSSAQRDGSGGTALDSEALRQEWNILRTEAQKSNAPQSVVHSFVHGKTKTQLLAFLRANRLPLDSKASKEDIARQVTQLIRVSRVIAGNSR